MNEHKKFQVSRLKEYIDQQFIPELFTEEEYKEFNVKTKKKIVKSVDDLKKEKAALYAEVKLDEDGFGDGPEREIAMK